MMIGGGSRAGPADLAAHLLRTDENDVVRVIEIRGVAAADLPGALARMQAVAALTDGTKGLYHASIDPDTQATMTPAQWARSVAVLEKELGLDGQPRALVYHIKRGEDDVPREHMHVVWQRTDLDTHTLRHDGWNYDAHKRAAIALEQAFGHALAPRQRQPEALSKDERQQAKRTGIKPEDVKADLTAAWQATRDGQEFRAAIEAQGYRLAVGARGLVAIDAAGGAHSVARRIDGANTAAVRARMADVDPASLPDVEQARAMVKEARQMRQERPEHHRAPEIAPERVAPSQASPQAPQEASPVLADRHAATLARAQTEDERQAQLKAERAAAVRAEKEAWKVRRREDMARRAQASAALRGSFKEAAASPQERVLTVLSEMAKAWPQDREDREALWERAEAIAVRDHHDRLTEIREADDPKRGDYRRAAAARAALLVEQGAYTNEQVRDRAAALKEAETARAEARQTATDEAKRIHGRAEEKYPLGASPAQYDAIAAKVRHPRLEAALRADLEARSGVRLADLSPADRDALAPPIQAEMKRRQAWEKALAVSRAKVNRDGQPALEAALEQRSQERREAREPFAPPPRRPVPSHAPMKTPAPYQVSVSLGLKPLQATAIKAVGAVGRLADSILDMFSAPPPPGATPPPPSPDPDIAASAKLNDEEQARFAAAAAEEAERQRAIADIQKKMSQAKGLRLKP
jgi:hypothetical protein